MTNVKSATFAPKINPKPKVDEPSIADRTPIESSGRTARVPAITTPVTKAEIRKNFDKFKSRFIASSGFW
jgi:hypothetical protein